MVNDLIMSEHVQPVLDDIEAVKEDKHSYHKARLKKSHWKVGEYGALAFFKTFGE